jgi:hypothetical protein
MVESTGIACASAVLPGGRPRIPFPDRRMAPSFELRWSSRRDASLPTRYRARYGRRDLERALMIRPFPGPRVCARYLDFGASHEPIRVVVYGPRSSSDT